MNGRAQVHRERQRLDQTFQRASSIAHNDFELRSDFARYLCVLVSGFLEQSVIEILTEHVRQQSSPSVQKYAGAKLQQFTTAKAQNVINLVGSFDADWHNDLTSFLVDDYKAAMDSVVASRHAIAHGQFVGITMHSVDRYYERVKEVVEHIAELCLP